MQNLSELTQRLQQQENLSVNEAEQAARLLAEEGLDDADKEAFLTALHGKGETPEEVTAFARVYRTLARDPGLGRFAARGIDIVGTGGTGSGGYNVSTVSSLIVASCGVPVLKHGNRAITSRSGSADFLAALGLPIQADPSMMERSLEQLNFCFFFAPAFHPAFRYIMPVRKAMAAQGKRSIFNILGPLINPAQPASQLLGVPGPEWVEPLASALHQLGLQSGLAVCCSLPDGKRMDELTTVGENRVQGIGRLQDFTGARVAADLGLPQGKVGELAGGLPEDNMVLLNDMMAGRGPQTLADTICLNAGAALWIVGKVDAWVEGIALAREQLQGGALKAWLREAKTFYQAFAV